jgi:hypothetical protein
LLRCSDWPRNHVLGGGSDQTKIVFRKPVASDMRYVRHQGGSNTAEFIDSVGKQASGVSGITRGYFHRIRSLAGVAISG